MNWGDLRKSFTFVMTGYKMKWFYSFICLTRGFVLKLERIDLARQLDCQFGLHGAWVFSKQTLMQ